MTDREMSEEDRGGRALRAVLAVDALLSALLGALLLFYPGSIVDGLGLPDPDPAIYANLSGAVLLGFATALARASTDPRHNRGVIEAAIVANVLSAVVLAIWLSALDTGASATGKAVLWIVAAGLAVLAALQARALRSDSS